MILEVLIATYLAKTNYIWSFINDQLTFAHNQKLVQLDIMKLSADGPHTR